MIQIKICGLRDQQMVESAVLAGANRVGLVLVATSPRAVQMDAAAQLARLAHTLGAEPWLVVRLGSEGGQAVDQSVDNHVDELVRLVEETPEIGAVQLHGRETPEQVGGFREQLRTRGGRAAVVKAHGVATADDLSALSAFAAADAFLLDAKPPKGADREGGFGEAFDWSILQGFDPGKPWVLSGGLTAENVAEAIRITGACAVDVSSGVERAPGHKDEAKMRAFVEAVRGAE